MTNSIIAERRNRRLCTDQPYIVFRMRLSRISTISVIKPATHKLLQPHPSHYVLISVLIRLSRVGTLWSGPTTVSVCHPQSPKTRIKPNVAWSPPEHSVSIGTPAPTVQHNGDPISRRRFTYCDRTGGAGWIDCTADGMVHRVLRLHRVLSLHRVPSSC